MTRQLTEPRPELNELTRQVIGAAIEVHRTLGPGFLETVYEEGLCTELEIRGIAFSRQVPIEITYEGRVIAQARLDLVVADQLVVELKAVPSILSIHRAQVISYLKAIRQPLGLLINFCVPSLPMGVNRIVFSGDPEG